MVSRQLIDYVLKVIEWFNFSMDPEYVNDVYAFLCNVLKDSAFLLNKNATTLIHEQVKLFWKNALNADSYNSSMGGFTSGHVSDRISAFHKIGIPLHILRMREFDEPVYKELKSLIYSYNDSDQYEISILVSRQKMLRNAICNYVNTYYEERPKERFKQKLRTFLKRAYSSLIN